MNDDDWNVYRAIVRPLGVHEPTLATHHVSPSYSLTQSKTAGESDGEREELELSEISKVLEKHDPSFMR